VYSVYGQTGTLAGTANHVISQIWNPHATQRIKVVSFVIAKRGTGGADIAMRRTSARGATPNNTKTPGISNHHNRGVAPPSGALVDYGSFGTQPTLVGVDLGIRWESIALIGWNMIYVIPGGIEVPPGSGLALIQKTASGYSANVTWTWMEDW
jgi:hypothetical protein